MREEVLKRGEGGMWPWLLQRVTAVVLLYGLAVHLVVGHITGIGELTFSNIGERLASGFFIATDFILLAASVFHGLNGVRMVLLDYSFWATRRNALNTALILIGVAALVYGSWALWPWLTS